MASSLSSSSPSSSSSSSSRVYEKYDVFLSFRGEDTRENFTSHLYAALCSKKIKMFIDSYDLERGDEISQALLNAIEESKIAVIIFSKGYATSRWCLEELAKIIEGKKAGDLIVPIFYHVDPSNVRNQKRTYEEAFVRHEKIQSSEKVMRWRNALREAANLSGFDSSNIRLESTLVEEIVNYISKKLNQMSPSDNKDLIGVESKIEKVESLLRLGLKDVSSSIGIWGMGGIGKTTLARAIFNQISSKFEKAYFQDNVGEECKKKNGLTRLSQKVLFAILDDKHAILDSIFTKRRLCSMKILIVFDDVTCFEQIEKFTGDCFGSGSRIIITSRDKQVLKTCGVEQDNIYKVEELSYDEALELFCRHAFKQNQPTVGYMELSKWALTFAKGIPLALKIFGCMLFGKTDSEWKHALKKLERIPNLKILDVLKISYDGLENEEQKIFLDIACFFNGDDKNFVKKIPDDSGFAADIRVSVLIDKSLITLTYDGKIIMHDLLQEMGRKIVSEESKDLGKRSRLWHREDINRVLKRDMGTGAIECIRLEMSKTKPFKLHPHAFSNMHSLRFLDFYCHRSFNFYNSHYKGGYICKEGQIDNKVHPSEDLEFVLFELRYFCWYGYPLPSLPSTFDVENLVSLVMPCSKIKILNFVQECNKLKHINLSNSKLLTRITDLSMIPNIESMILEGCTSLIEISSSEKYLNKLAIINLRGCISLESFPSTSCVNSVESLDLSSCQIPKSFDNLNQLSFLRELFLVGQNFELIPGIEKLSNLVDLDVSNCQRLRSLPELSNLVDLDVSNCQRLRSLPKLSNLVTLRASNCQRLRSLPELSNLVALCVCNCQRLRSLPELPSLYNLYADNCTSLEALRVPFLRRTVIRLANCHKLDRNVLKAKVENALELYAEGRKHSAPFWYGCFPGNEIPNWYSYQNMGSSIIIKLLPDLTNYKSIVFDMCFVVNPHHPVDYDPPLIDSELSDEYWHHYFHNHVEKHYIPLDHVCVTRMSMEKQRYEHMWKNKYNSVVFHFHCAYEDLK